MRASDSRLVLVLLLIGCKIGANFLSQSCSAANAKPITFRHSNENRSIQLFQERLSKCNFFRHRQLKSCRLTLSHFKRYPFYHLPATPRKVSIPISLRKLFTFNFKFMRADLQVVVFWLQLPELLSFFLYFKKINLQCDLNRDCPNQHKKQKKWRILGSPRSSSEQLTGLTEKLIHKQQ